MRDRSIAARGLLVLAVLAGLLVTSTSRAAGLPDDVRRRLAAGEVVVTDTMPPGASKTASGGTALARVRAAPEQVWRVIVDYHGHPRYYPRVTAAEVVESDAKHALVRYEVSVGPFAFNFFMAKYPDPRRRRVEWRLAEGRAHGLFRENSGYWQVDADAADASLVTYAIAVRTLLPAFVTGGAERDSLVETVTALRKLVEEGSAPARR
ncbi:MAG TPA: SRPBCC family protein [Methylomirabilota bacterium]|nr:SRPBCC family protein [Methylomirabilota bacterium]